MTPTRSQSLFRKVRKIVLALSIGVVLALLLAELGLRYVVHHPKLDLGELGGRLRNPENYSDGNSDDDYWKIQYLAIDPAQAGPAENPDTITGWTGHYVKPGTYESVDAGLIRGRTPILLYGDSFAQCNTPPYECFPAILERSDLADRYCLLNYGVGGYGLDQIYILLKNSIDHYASLDPIVIVSLLVEGDLDRSVLSFRCWPKPRLDIVGDELKARGPVMADPAEWVRQNPITFPSYLWRYLIYKHISSIAGWQDSMQGDHRRLAEKRTLNFKILKEIERELTARHLRHFMLLFHVEENTLEKSSASEWQEALLYDTARLLSIPLVDTRPSFKVASRRIGAVSQYFGHGSPLYGHWNALGNRVAFEAIRQGVAGDFESKDTSHLEAWIESFATGKKDVVGHPFQLMGRGAERYAEGGPSWVRYEGAVDPRNSGDGQRVENLFMRAGAALPTEVRFEVEPGPKRFTAVVSTIDRPDAPCAAEDIELDVRVDGRSAWRQSIHHGAEPVPIDVDIAGHGLLALVVTMRNASDECAWIRLTKPHIE